MVTQCSLETAQSAALEFAIGGALDRIESHERGHIHNTFVSTWVNDGKKQRFLHQQLNNVVFKDIEGLMYNIDVVTGHLRQQVTDDGMKTLSLVPTKSGGTYLNRNIDSWRTYEYIERTDSFDLCSTTDQAYEAARAFGRFQARLNDLDVNSLRETIPFFFSSPHRYQQFEAALAKDPKERSGGVAREIDFVRQRKKMVDVIEDRIRTGRIPTRIVHGDTKLNNVLFDRDTQKAVSVIDLDTCMPAYSLYDFGDLVRFTAATAKEDETDLEKVGTDLELYHALVAGYREGTGGFLTAEEVELMPFAARLVTFTIGLRFLADYLLGDVYFKVSHHDHNLERARVQFKMVERMEEKEKEMVPR